jgi:hypothetical protein
MHIYTHRAQLEAGASLAEGLLGAVDDRSDVGKLLAGLLSNPFQLQALRVLLGVQTHPALPAPAAAPAEHTAALAAAGAASLAAGGTAGQAAQDTPAADSYALARDVVDGKGVYAPSFDSEHRSLRLAAKLFNITPAELPPDVRPALLGWLGSAPAAVEGYVRPGCVFLCLHMLLDQA